MRAWILLIACLTVLATPVIADGDIAAAQTVIRAQERAMVSDDAATAYSYAGPPITSMYREAETFIWMVRRGYAPVYRHQSFELGAGRIQGDQISQEVHIIDAEGVAWEALYTLEQQSDGSWKIISCVLSKAVGA